MKTHYVLDTQKPLGRREIEVLKHIANGEGNREISIKMNTSIHTTKMHIRNIFNKLNAQDRTEAVIKAIRKKVINIKMEE